MRCVWHAAYKGDIRNSNKALAKTHEGKRSLGRFSDQWEEVDWIYLTQFRTKWQAHSTQSGSIKGQK
jgi:hypothetical protein